LIPDPRATLTPSEIVELKLAALLNGPGQGVSQMIVCRRCSRNHRPAPMLADAPANTPSVEGPHRL
jgi:hypothetical protein